MWNLRTVTAVVAAGALLAVGAAWPSSTASLVCVAIAAFGAAAAILLAKRWVSPARGFFWSLFASVFASWGCANLVVAFADLSATGRFTLTELLYVPGFALLGGAIVIASYEFGVTRQQRADAAIGTLGVMTLLWGVAVEPNLEVADAEHWGAVAVVAMLGVLIARLIRLSSSEAGRIVAGRLLAIAVGLLLGAALVAISPELQGTTTDRIVAAATVLAYLLVALAFMHPSIGDLEQRRGTVDEPESRRLVPAVTAALLAPLLGLAINVAADGVTDIWVFVGLGAVLVTLVQYRILSFVRHSDELRARAELSEQKFRMVFESAGLGISIGRGGMMTETNPAYQQMLGYDAEELATMHYTAISHPDDAHLDLENAARVAAGELRHFSFEKRVVRKDGTPIWVEVTVSLAADGSFGISLIEDITTRRKLEEELRQSQKMEAVGQLAGGIAHDFNNLMTAVLGYADILRRELAPGDPMHEAVEVIADSAVRAGELTRQLLAFSRRQVLRLEPTDLGEVVSRFLPILHRVLPENIDLDADLEGGVVARVDAAQLEQVLLNLVMNARDALPAGGHIAVSVRGNGAAELAVSDDGVGMDETTRAHIFEPFFTTKPKNAGTGLGLATVDGIVAQIGGEIDVETAVGAGATFRIRLPLSGGAVAIRPVRAGGSGSAGHGTVLLTEDEDVVRRVTVHLLDAAGYDVVAAASGEEALALLAAGETADVLVTDMVMTGIGGQELARRVREIVPDMPVLFISGYTDDAFGGGLGSDVLLTKPFSPAELTGAIERVRAAVPVA